MKHTYSLLAASVLLAAPSASAQTLLGQHFDNIAADLSNGWIATNMSNPLGAQQWQQGTLVIGEIALTGDSTSYAENSFQATDANGSGTISDWFISPAVTLEDGDSIALWTISFNSNAFPDRLEVRISPNGGSSVGADENSVGDFTNLVFSINPNLNTTDYPSVTGLGNTWTRFGGAVTGLGAPTSCRVAMRYFVTDGGGTGANSSSIGVDELDVFRGSSSIGISERALADVSLKPNPTSDRLFINIGGLTGSFDLTLVNAAGQLILTDRINNSTVLDMATYEAGVYMLELRNTSTGAVHRERVVKQ